MPDRIDDMSRRDTWSYECVEPELGREIHRLDDPDLAPALARDLRDHLAICDACRLQRALGPELARATASSPPRPLLLRPAALTTGAGILLLAASLMLMLTLPPRSRMDGLVMRAGEQAVLVSPVDGELVRDRTPTIRWRPVPGATAYRVTVDAVGGGFHWEGLSHGTSLELPDRAHLPLDTDFRVILEPVPEDLAPAGGWSTIFRTGSTGAWLRYRLHRAPTLLRALAVLGLAVLLSGLITAAYPRRRRLLMA